MIVIAIVSFVLLMAFQIYQYGLSAVTLIIGVILASSLLLGFRLAWRISVKHGVLGRKSDNKTVPLKPLVWLMVGYLALKLITYLMGHYQPNP